ncbi:MAG: GNAT family N-acetyltransferase [Planctomycetes bacterium]|nr:GNAT family N-acetyltransferase [Planctomycetota bacterium]
MAARIFVSTDTINLRKVEEDDIRAVAKWISKKRYFGDFQPQYYVERTSFLGKLQRNKFSSFLIAETKNNQSFGVVYIYQTPKTNALSFDFRITDPDFRGKSLGAEIVKAATKHMFAQNREVQRVFIECDEKYAQMCRVLLKCGFESYKRVMLSRSREVKLHFRMTRERFDELISADKSIVVHQMTLQELDERPFSGLSRSPSDRIEQKL